MRAGKIIASRRKKQDPRVEQEGERDRRIIVRATHVKRDVEDDDRDESARNDPTNRATSDGPEFRENEVPFERPNGGGERQQALVRAFVPPCAHCRDPTLQPSHDAQCPHAP